MRLQNLLIVLAVAAIQPAAMAAAPTEAVVNVPAVAGITVDGSAADWGDQGFHVDAMAPANGDLPPRALSNAAFRLGWDERGLLASVEVHDPTPKSEPAGTPLNRGDSVDLIFGRGDTIDRVQVIVSPGRTAAHPGTRSSAVDMRQQMADRRRTIKSTVAASTSRDGYTVEILIPWGNLNVQPHEGVEMLLQLRVNDAAASAEQSCQFRWNPGSANNVRSMSRIRLSSAAAVPRVEAAASGRYEDLHRIRAAVVATRDAAGKPVEILDSSRVLAKGILIAHGTGAAASLVIPMPARGESYGPLAVQIAGQTVATLPLASDKDLRENALADDAILFKEFVFSGNAFPECAFEKPVLADELLGPYTLATTFYDATFNVVKVPTEPGRYGAIVEVRAGTGGPVIKRFSTLYHTAGPVNWGAVRLNAPPALPAELGIAPGVLDHQLPTLSKQLERLLHEQAVRDPSAAVTLAALHELPPDAAAVAERNNPAEVDRRWWYHLKRKTGDFVPLPYLTYLPKDYARDSQKRWPLILSLHGAGERGLPLESLKAYGIPRICEESHDTDFIAICPQCPPRESWLAASLNDLLNEVSVKYRVDPDRIYVTGASMGGNATWNFAQQYPDRVAAIAPVCGGGDPDDVARLKDLPVWIFHGESDPVVPFRRARAMADALRKIDGRVKITSYPGVGHESWNAAYATPDLIPWLLQQRRGQPQQPPASKSATQPDSALVQP